jgi:hypothetical protein
VNRGQYIVCNTRHAYSTRLRTTDCLTHPRPHARNLTSRARYVYFFVNRDGIEYTNVTKTRHTHTHTHTHTTHTRAHNKHIHTRTHTHRRITQMNTHKHTRTRTHHSYTYTYTHINLLRLAYELNFYWRLCYCRPHTTCWFSV